MAVVYRSIWTDDRLDLHQVAREEFSSWLAGKGIDLEVPESGAVSEGSRTVSRLESEAGGARAQRLRLEEDSPDDYWATTVTTIEQGEQRWGWVDLEWVASNVYADPPDFASPRIARTLIAGGHARVGSVVLNDLPMTVTSDDVPALKELIFNADRLLPIAVITMATGEHFDTVRDRAERAAKALAGVALVAFVTGPAVHRLNEELGSELEVFGGAVRVYLPGIDPHRTRSFRHRYVKREQVSRRPQAAAHILARLIFRQASQARPPLVFRRDLRGGFTGAADADLVELFDLQDADLQRLTESLQEAEDLVEVATLEQEEAQVEAAALAARVRYLEEELAAAGVHLRGAPTPTADVPNTAETLQDAAELARSHLSCISLPTAATADLDTLDAHERSGVWGQKAWQSLRALSEYARRKADGKLAGDFKIANREGQLGTFGIPDNWVTMHESATTDQNPTYRQARTFSVPEDVDVSGAVYMAAHIKLQAGGRPCPRIHFHDDTDGASGVVHVGWLGDHLENKQTN
jgi:hypothetical protein